MLELEQKLICRYHLEKRLLKLDDRLEQLHGQLPQCKYRLRQSREALLSCEAPGLKSLLDKLTGKWEQTHETLLAEVRAADARLSLAQRELEKLQTEREDVLTQLEPLRRMGDGAELALGLEEPGRTAMLHLEARLCALKLIPALEENARTLELAQQWARPHNPPEAVPGRTLATLLSQSEAWARESMTLLEQIAACGILLDIHPYFTNPAGYINGVTRFAQLDRFNSALAAIGETAKQVRELLLQLPEPEET